jgi:hemerythrin-like domain-containing protein
MILARRIRDPRIRLTGRGLDVVEIFSADRFDKFAVNSMRQFIRMYSPHEAREDTVLFPAFRGIVSAHEFDSLGEEFEKKEDELFGDDGFFKVVDQVAEIEKKLGIYDLSKFTPNV